MGAPQDGQRLMGALQGKRGRRYGIRYRNAWAAFRDGVSPRITAQATGLPRRVVAAAQKRGTSSSAATPRATRNGGAPAKPGKVAGSPAAAKNDVTAPSTVAPPHVTTTPRDTPPLTCTTTGGSYRAHSPASARATPPGPAGGVATRYVTPPGTDIRPVWNRRRPSMPKTV